MLYLFGPKETDFVNGDSDLIHNTYDEVVDRSKGFYLKFKIALDKDERYKDIKKEMIISAYTPDGWNQFRVFDIYNHTNHVEVVATQLHYDLNYKKVFPFVVNRTTAQTALNVFVQNFKSDLPNFKFTSNITDVHSFSTDDDLERLDEGHNALEILNRIASRWGGELKVDGYNVHLTHKLGKFTNALLYEHKNISEFVDETSMSEIITRIHAVSRFRPEREEGSTEEPKEVTIKVVVDSPLIDEYAQVYEEDYTYNDARTRDQLIAWARLKYSTNNVDKPARSINVETNIIDGQEINYGDDLVLKYTKHDVDEIIRCVGYQYNPNSRQYISVTLGSNLNSLASTITGSVHDSTKNQLSNIEKQVQIIKYASNNHNRVTTGPLPIPDPIEGDMWYYHPDGRPNDVELRIFQDGGWVTIVSDMTGENVRRAIADLELEAEGLAEDIVASDKKADEAKETAGLAKSAVDALEIITQETAGKMVDVEQIVATAESNATDALAKARESATNSSGALALAGQAATDAQTAIDNAEAAQTVAQTAINNANTALSTAGNADSKAGQAIAKANAIPTTVSDIIADKKLVNGSYVDTKVDAATGAWSQELVRVEGKIPTEIGGRNLVLNTQGEHEFRTDGSFLYKFPLINPGDFLGKELTFSFKAKSSNGTNMMYISIGNGGSTINRITGNITIPKEYTDFKYTFTSTPDDRTTTLMIVTGTVWHPDNEGSITVTDIKLETGNIATDWTPAPEDLYSQEEFKLFNAQYTQDVTGMTGRLTTVESSKLDGTTFQTFKQSEYQVTADTVASTVERVDTAEGLITTQGTAISQNATSIASKADKTVVDTLSGTVTTQGTAISQNATDIASKAAQTEVDTVKGTVATHTSTLTQQAKDISARLTQTQVNSLVSDKGYSTVSYVDTEISATAGAIRTEMTAVEGKIPTEIGGRNFVLNTQGEYVSEIARGTLYRPRLSKTGDFLGTELTLSFKAKSSNGTNMMYISLGTGGGTMVRIATDITIPKEYADFKYTFTSIPDARIDELLIVTGTTWYPNNSGSITVTDIKLEKGKVATDWTPAPEDMMNQSDFNTFKAEYEQSASGWSSKLLQIEQADYASKTWSNQTFATPQSVTTQLSSYAKTSALNGMVTETSLANKSYITSSAVNTLLTSYAKTTALNGLATESYVGTQINTTAAGIRTEMTAIEGKIPTEIGGRNLVKDSGVEQKLDSSITNNIPYALAKDIDYLNGEEVTISFEAKSDVNGTVVEVYPRKNAKYSGFSILKEFTLSTDYTRYSYTWSYDFDRTYRAENIFFRTSEHNDIYIRGVQLERGSVPTDWTPAPEDMMEQNDFNTFKAEYDQSAQGWSSKLLQIEQAGYATKTWSNQTFATPQSVTTQLQSYAKTTDLNGLATQTYVGSQISATAKTIRSEITAVEGKIPTYIGGRNYLIDTHESYTNDNSSHAIKLWDIADVEDLRGQEVTFSFELKSSSSSNGFYASVSRAAASTLFSVVREEKSPTAYKKYEFTFTFPNDTTASTMMIVSRVANFSGNTGTTTFRNLKLEKGNVATDWSPAPEDMATTKQVSSIEQKANSIQALVGTTKESVASAVMTSNLWETEVSKVIDEELEQEFKTVEGEVPFHEYTPNPTRTLLEGDRSITIYLPTTADTTMDGKRVIVEMEYKARAGSKGNHASYIQYGTIKSSEPLLYSSLTNVKYHLYIPPGTAKGNIMDLHTNIVNPGNFTWGDINKITVSTVEKTQVPVSGTKTGAISTKITQLYDMINLSVLGKEGAMSRIAMGEEGIQIDGKLLHITAKTFIDNAVIKSAMIDTLDAGKITTGTLNATNVNVINLDANSISGNEASFIRAMFMNRNSALQITGTGITVSKSNGNRTFEVDSSGVTFYSDTGPGAYISTHNVVTWNGSSWVDSGANSVLFASELRHSIGIGYKILTNGKYMTRDAIRLDRSGTGVPELQVNLPIKNIDYQRGRVSGEDGTYFRNTQDTAGIWMGDNGKLILISYGKLYNSTTWLNK